MERKGINSEKGLALNMVLTNEGTKHFWTIDGSPVTDEEAEARRIRLCKEQDEYQEAFEEFMDKCDEYCALLNAASTPVMHDDDSLSFQMEIVQHEIEALLPDLMTKYARTQPSPPEQVSTLVAREFTWDEGAELMNSLAFEGDVNHSDGYLIQANIGDRRGLIDIFDTINDQDLKWADTGEGIGQTFERPPLDDNTEPVYRVHLTQEQWDLIDRHFGGTEFTGKEVQS